ncbi:hypothetical protein ABOM_010325 [Aspergillus bombycis]|uniref:Nephrocystin 3-like N-terminal domain-containing protein n=1 Tax=Aspergillus bombycis TaxID=109264 RepID=A0A1F7ZN99_9EURO|nr:hypothetical protein ABOM_010325 [Aspergillus bombycis]OGM40936.1 hypothetical protein ABOM_010325 [Aspergillus bombycis]
MAESCLPLHKYTVGWVCALPVELAAACKMLDKRHRNLPQDDNDSNLYTLGSIGGHNVVIAGLPGGVTGTTSAAVVATQMKARFKGLRFGLMVGLGGGVSSPDVDIRLGDVVISQPSKRHGGVVQYDFGKTRPGQFERTGFLNSPPPVLLNALTKLQANQLLDEGNMQTYLSQLSTLPHFSRDDVGPDILFESSYEHPEGQMMCEKCDREKIVARAKRGHNEVVLHFGTIASANQVMRDGITRDKLASELGGVLCFEMEAAGLMNNFPCLVIRGICDYSDSHKNKKWQGYAAAAAAAAAKEILSLIPGHVVEEPFTVDEIISLQLAIENVNVDQFLKRIVSVGVRRPCPDLPPVRSDDPKYWWISRNIDFQCWQSSDSSQFLWLSGRSECNIQQATAFQIGKEFNKAPVKPAFVQFHCSDLLPPHYSLIKAISHSLFHQLISNLPANSKDLAIKDFLRCLYSTAVAKSEELTKRIIRIDDKTSKENIIDMIMRLEDSHHWSALKAALTEVKQDLVLVLYHIDLVSPQNIESILDIVTFLKHLVQKATRKVKVLLTSKPNAEIREILAGVPSIEHDKERKECLANLRFNNERYAKIASEHNGSFKWIWNHEQYKKWSKSESSSLLYLQGKPGSGKSTMTKYFTERLLQQVQCTEPAAVAKFFYSYRDGEVQLSHYNMLRSILYDILDQDENFFYHQLQSEYRDQPQPNKRVEWGYESLQRTLSSLETYRSNKRFYLIIDAVDESEENDRRHILELLFNLCCNAKHCVLKVFIASRPVPVLERRISEFHSLIRLQDETQKDILEFSMSFLNRLELSSYLEQAKQYIISHAQGVFLWVKLVGDALIEFDEEGHSKEVVFNFLKSLPTELEEFYTRMLLKITQRNSNILNAIKMLQFVLFTYRPLSTIELLHAIGISGDSFEGHGSSEQDFNERVPQERRILSCGGNFLEITDNNGYKAVQVMHQTAREFFLGGGGLVSHPEFRIKYQDSHSSISIVCLQYLNLCVVNAAQPGTPEETESWTYWQFHFYVEYLEGKPLAKYALCYLKDHLAICLKLAKVQDRISRFREIVKDRHAFYLLSPCLNDYIGHDFPLAEQKGASKRFKDRLLHVASLNGFSTAVEILIAAGADINAKDEKGRTPCSRAAERDHLAVVRILAERKDIAIDLKDENGRTPLSWAAEYAHNDVVSFLMDLPGVEKDSKDSYRRTPVLWAAREGNLSALRLFVRHFETRGAGLNIKDNDLDAKDNFGRTPLSWAAGAGHEAAARILLDEGRVCGNSRDNNGRTPLSLAAENGHEELVRLLAAREDVVTDSKDEDWRTPLSRAAENGHEAVVKFLLNQHDVNADSVDEDGRAPLSWAAEHGHEEIVQMLAGRADVNANNPDTFGRTPLSLAAVHGHEGVSARLATTTVIFASSTAVGNCESLHRGDITVDQCMLATLISGSNRHYDGGADEPLEEEGYVLFSSLPRSLLMSRKSRVAVIVRWSPKATGQFVLFLDLSPSLETEIQIALKTGRWDDPYTWHALLALEVKRQYQHYIDNVVQKVEAICALSHLAMAPEVHDLSVDMADINGALEDAENSMQDIHRQFELQASHAVMSTESSMLRLNCSQKLLLVAKDLNSIRSRVNMLQNYLQTHTMIDSQLIRNEAMRNLQLPEAVIVLMFLFLMYLPSIFVSSLFKMHGFGVINSGQEKGNMLSIDWLYWVITIPLILSGFSMVILCSNPQRRRLYLRWLFWCTFNERPVDEV